MSRAPAKGYARRMAFARGDVPMRPAFLLLALTTILATLAAPSAAAHDCTDAPPGDCGDCPAFENHRHYDADGSLRCMSCVVDGVICPYLEDLAQLVRELIGLERA